MAEIKGVCCTCQSSHPVRSSGGHQVSGLDFFPFEYEDPAGEAGGYLMVDHDAPWGAFCSGSGTMPQAIVRPKATVA